MKTLSRAALLFLLLLVLSGVYAFQYQTPVARQGAVSPTPTYDPLAEPPLPLNPTEFELGQNLYWHWCMPCHGDKGQGLTDEFRGIWEPEHQDCWGRGCHAGHQGDMGFPIPTIVPGLVDDTRLTQFSSLQSLTDFLAATHPPQSPGILKTEEYHAIAFFVFTMNGRPVAVETSTVAPVSTPAELPPKTRTSPPSQQFVTIVVVIVLVVLASITYFARKASRV